MPRKSKEFQKFDAMMTTLLAVPHSQIKAKLDAEKAEKATKKRKAKRSSASGHASNDKD